MYTAIRQVSSQTVLRPAYGRTYKTVDAMLKDWKDGKDFRFAPSGPYCSIRDLSAIVAEHPSTVYLQDPITKVQVIVA